MNAIINKIDQEIQSLHVKSHDDTFYIPTRIVFLAPRLSWFLHSPPIRLSSSHRLILIIISGDRAPSIDDHLVTPKVVFIKWKIPKHMNILKTLAAIIINSTTTTVRPPATHLRFFFF